MSCDYHVFCVTCQDRHDFNDANHQAPLMRKLIAHAKTIALLWPVMADIDELTLGTYYGPLDTSWFAVHAGHELRVIDEYGKLDGNCDRRVKCVHCKSEHWCAREHGHDGTCSAYPPRHLRSESPCTTPR